MESLSRSGREADLVRTYRPCKVHVTGEACPGIVESATDRVVVEKCAG